MLDLTKSDIKYLRLGMHEVTLGKWISAPIQFWVERRKESTTEPNSYTPISPVHIYVFFNVTVYITNEETFLEKLAIFRPFKTFLRAQRRRFLKSRNITKSFLKNVFPFGIYTMTLKKQIKIYLSNNF